MKPPPCQRAFAEAQRRRVQYPLSSGGTYKLEEALKILQDHVQTVQVIEQIVLGKLRPVRGEFLGYCVAEERARWLKSVPKSIAGILGYYVLPAIDALGGDNVPKARIHKLAEDARIHADSIVSHCDKGSAQISQSIKLEYSQMQIGRSMLAELLAEAFSFVERQLELAEQYQLRVVLPPTPVQ